MLKKCIRQVLEGEQNVTVKQSAMLALKSVLEEYDLFNESKNNCINFDLYTQIIEKVKINNNRFIENNVYDDITKDLIKRIESIDITGKSFYHFSTEEFLLLLQIEKINRVYNYNISDSNLSPYISRFISNKTKFDKIFLPYDGIAENTSIEKIVFDNKFLSVCDVSMAGREMKRIMVSLLLRDIYNKVILKRERDNYKIKQTYHIIIDEAHNYLSPASIDKDDLIYESCLDTIETIIKDGRKNGIFITLSTQRPSDVSNTILSQCHNYIIHKLINPKDIDIIRNSIPFLDEISGKMLTVLSPGNAIFSGTAFNKSNIISVNQLKDHFVNSKTPDLVNIWSENKEKGN
jgi:DNA helicase HerA-like ATPase